MKNGVKQNAFLSSKIYFAYFEHCDLVKMRIKAAPIQNICNFLENSRMFVKIKNFMTTITDPFEAGAGLGFSRGGIFYKIFEIFDLFF